MNSEMKKDALTDEALNKVSGGTDGVMEQLFKPGDWFDNRHGYFYKIVKVNSIDYSNIGNSEYEIEVYFLRDKYEYNDIRPHWQLANYIKC